MADQGGTGGTTTGVEADLISDAQLAEFCTFHENYVSRNIQLADAKAAIVLVAFSSVIALSLKDPHFIQALRGAFPWAFARPFSLQSLLAIATMAFCGAGTAIAFWVIVPRFATGRLKGQEIGFTYWKDVADRAGAGGGENYAQALRQLSHAGLIEDRLCHLGQLSRVCSFKMWWLPYSMWVGATGVVAGAGWFVIYADHLGG